MNIYIGHSRELNYKEALYAPIRKSRLNAEHTITLPHEAHEDASDFLTKDIIKACDVVVAEVSFPATGLGIELGWADAFGRPIICAYRTGSRISNSLNVICKTFIEYADADDLINKLEDALKTLKRG
ncbi:MAG: hypothetical protein Q8Q23_01255 [bacterium]|nr:hypothetical protein [bacterium]